MKRRPSPTAASSSTKTASARLASGLRTPGSVTAQFADLGARLCTAEIRLHASGGDFGFRLAVAGSRPRT